MTDTPKTSATIGTMWTPTHKKGDPNIPNRPSNPDNCPIQDGDPRVSTITLDEVSVRGDHRIDTTVCPPDALEPRGDVIERETAEPIKPCTCHVPVAEPSGPCACQSQGKAEIGDIILDTSGKPVPPQTGREIAESIRREIRRQTTDSVKESNPKDSIGVRKVGYSCLPTPVLAECGVGMLEGGCKYGRHNYRAIGVRASVYYDAVVCRHLGAWWEGEDIDKDSGMNHVTKAITALMVLRDAMIRGKMVDDRPPSTFGYIDALNEKAAEILDRYPEPKDAYTIDDQTGDEYHG